MLAVWQMNHNWNVLNRKYLWQAEAEKAAWWRHWDTLAPFILNKCVWSGFKYWWLTSATFRSVCLSPLLLLPRKTMRGYLWSFKLLRCTSNLSCKFCVNKLYSKHNINDQRSWGDLSTLKTLFRNNHERYFLTSNLFGQCQLLHSEWSAYRKDVDLARAKSQGRISGHRLWLNPEVGLHQALLKPHSE